MIKHREAIVLRRARHPNHPLPRADDGRHCAGGEFLSHDHTMAHWRELWIPQIFDRQRLGSWAEQGSKNVNARLREVTVGIMDSHTVEALPGSVNEEIERILQG